MRKYILYISTFTIIGFFVFIALYPLNKNTRFDFASAPFIVPLLVIEVWHLFYFFKWQRLPSQDKEGFIAALIMFISTSLGAALIIGTFWSTIQAEFFGTKSQTYVAKVVDKWSSGVRHTRYYLRLSSEKRQESISIGKKYYDVISVNQELEITRRYSNNGYYIDRNDIRIILQCKDTNKKLSLESYTKFVENNTTDWICDK